MTGVQTCALPICSYAYEHLKETICVPVIEVITPGSLAAVRSTRNGRIGIIGTQATISSNVYEKAVLEAGALERPDLDVRVFSAACPLFVGLAEEGWWNDEITLLTADRYLEPLVRSGVDTLVLGCTHYPLLKGAISRIMGSDVVLIDSAGEVVRKVSDVLEHTGLATDNTGSGQVMHEYYTSDSEEKFIQLGSSFLQREISRASKIDIEHSCRSHEIY